MLEMEKPVIEVAEISEDGRYGRFVVEPLERGYGTTLGNSLRRVLLSSLPGAAVTSVRIDGVLHEFSTLPGVVEDSTEIILNLKGLSLRVHGDGEKVLRLNVTGPGEVRAQDIEASDEVEIVNPDLYICTLDEDGQLSIEMTVGQGRGYVPAERNKRLDDPIGVIPVDSIFTPVRRVNFRVEDTRVGKVTDYDRLTLEVWTNGSIKPDEAVSLAARILVEHLNLFIGLTDEVADVEIMAEKEEDERNRLLEMSIEELDLSVRSFNCLKRAGINSIGELVEKTPEEMLKVRNLGRKSLDEVEQKLALLGLSLKESEQ
ncbi:MAG TPA: DNA-directed RNA polymerase subunit alpha [Sphingobacteriaceae bacterium]|nr:DNA-directed RNA polymerase subunit alpha [Sphingobacteriaceae bacterium]